MSTGTHCRIVKYTLDSGSHGERQVGGHFKQYKVV